MSIDTGATTGTNGWTPSNIKMVYENKTTLSMTNNASSFNYEHKENASYKIYRYISSLMLKVVYPNGKIVRFDVTPSKIEDGKYSDTLIEIILNQSGEYSLTYDMIYDTYVEDDGHGDTIRRVLKVFSYIYVNPDNSSLVPYTLKTAIDRLLNVTPLRTVGESNKYSFDPILLAEYVKEESPEFAFTGHTLFEALLIIAQYKGAFPELNDGVITFRKLWNGIRLSEEDLPDPIDEISCSDINQYCTYLESEVQNLVGVNDSRVGSIVEPYAGGYKTTRAASGSEISQDTVVIPTDYNQYLHIKEEIGYINGQLPSDQDITPYVYESGDYNALTDMRAAYPGSKAYALQWTQMGKNITELAHRVKSTSQIAQALTEPALANIIQAKTGEPYSTTDSNVVTYIMSLIDPDSDADSFADVMFRTTYIPVINARIKQYKEHYDNFHYDGSLKYNQTAELVDSEMYGEHLKCLLRKIGNATKRKVYIFDKIDDVPKVGTLVDDYSVYNVQMSIRENKVVATISYVKYAELSQYIGVKNPWKDSDVSVDKCYNRQISYNEFLLFTHDNTKSSTSKSIASSTMEFLLPNTMPYPLTCVEATGYMPEEDDGSKEKLNTVLLPVVSLAMGNSIMFQWEYQDNYSSGYMSEEAPQGATSILSGTKYNRAQKAVKYADMYGKLETYSFGLLFSGPLPDSENLIWLENAESVLEKGEIDYQGTVELEIQSSIIAKITLTEIYPFDITVTFNAVLTTGDNKEYTTVIRAGSISTRVTVSGIISSLEYVSAKTYDVTDTIYYNNPSDVFKQIGYSLPLKPTELRSTTTLEEWHDVYAIAVNDLLIQKNSSEALAFSVQLHYCTDSENFIIGSGLSNFCPLIGGSADELALYGFNERINIFNRHINVSTGTELTLPEITLTNNKLKITLPATVNDYNAWAYVGKDKKGNNQIIFGENKDLDGSDFNTELFLLPMRKVEDVI